MIPSLNLKKHKKKDNPRIFIGNQNRHNDHQQLIEGLNQWCRRDKTLKLIIIQDQKLAMALPKTQVEFHLTSNYEKYRSLLRGCHIALMPLSKSHANACKTPIKWIEAAAESVVCVGGPELYSAVFYNCKEGVLVHEPKKIAKVAEELWLNPEVRCKIATAAHRSVQKQHSLKLTNIYRLWMYNHLWRIREQIDQKLLNRLPQIANTKEFQS